MIKLSHEVSVFGQETGDEDIDFCCGFKVRALALLDWKFEGLSWVGVLSVLQLDCEVGTQTGMCSFCTAWTPRPSSFLRGSVTSQTRIESVQWVVKYPNPFNDLLFSVDVRNALNLWDLEVPKSNCEGGVGEVGRVCSLKCIIPWLKWSPGVNLGQVDHADDLEDEKVDESISSICCWRWRGGCAVWECGIAE